MDQHKAEKQKTSTVIIFFINGIVSLLGWNAVLAALDFFANSFEGYNIYSFLPVPLFIGYLVTGSSYHQISNRFKYVNLIIAGNTIVNIALILILIVCLTLDQTLFGFIALLTCSFLIGLGANVTQLTFFAMINYLSQECVSKFTVGTAVSGLVLTLVRIVLIAIIGSTTDSNIQMIIYFVIAITVLTINILMNIKFCRSSVYKHKIDHFLLHHDKQKEHLDSPTVDDKSILSVNEESKEQHNETEDKSDSGSSQALGQQYVHQEERIQNQNYFRTLYQTIFKITPYPFIIMFTFVVTFILFPGPSFSKKIDGLSTAWSLLLFNLMYGIGDTVGKYSADLNRAFNHKSLIFIFISRLFFFIPITFMATGADIDDSSTNNYFFPFFNQFLFAFTNGFCINASFIMAFKICPLIYKKYAGVLCGLMLQVGIIGGTILQIPYSYAIGIN